MGKKMQKGERSKERVVSATKLYKRSKRQKRCKKGLPNFGRCGIILERQGPPERMTSDRLRSKKIGPLRFTSCPLKSFQASEKKCLTNDHKRDKIIKLSAARLRRTGP